MMRRLGVPMLGLLLAAGVAACGEIPQPFRHDGAAPPLTRPKFARGLTVHPNEDLTDGTALAAELVKALEVHEIPAVVRTGPAFGHVVEVEPGEDGGRPGLRWLLRAPDGDTQTIRFQALAGAPLGRSAQSREAAATATALAARLADPDAAPKAAVTPARRTSVTVKPFTGLPGDGDTALTKATRRALERSGLLVRDDGADYMVEGRVTLIPGLPGEETVVVVWTVRDKAGTELAAIEQEGVVPRGRLEAPWGSLARDIAEGGAAGVREVAEAGRQGP